MTGENGQDNQQNGDNGSALPPAGTTQTGSSISSITISSRIPTFWRDRPSLWFAQFEAITSTQKAGDEAKAQLLVAHLEKADLEQISDILEDMPTTGKYDAIKKRLKAAYEESTSRKIHRVLEEMEMGDQKPSQFYRRMRDTAGSSLSEDVIKLLWLKGLPANIRPVVQAASVSTDELMELADRIVECVRPGETVNAVSNSGTAKSNTEAKLEALQAQINELQTLLKRQTFRRGSRSRSRSRGRFTNRSQSPKRSSEVCYYHHRFGAAARKCTAPCSFAAPPKSQEN